MFVHALNRFHPRCAHNLTTSTITPILPFPPSWVKHPSWALHVWVSWINTHYSITVFIIFLRSLLLASS